MERKRHLKAIEGVIKKGHLQVLDDPLLAGGIKAKQGVFAREHCWVPRGMHDDVSQGCTPNDQFLSGI